MNLTGLLVRFLWFSVAGGKGLIFWRCANVKPKIELRMNFIPLNVPTFAPVAGCTLCKADMVSALGECIAYWGKRHRSYANTEESVGNTVEGNSA